MPERAETKAICPRCRGTGTDPCGFGSPDPWVCMTCGGSRSPQGEDHGPEPDALGGLPPSQPKENQ